jgi:hypothetical protein
MTVEEKFRLYDADNPHVYGLYKRFALEALKAGSRRISSKLIIERIRWEAAIATSGSGWNTASKKPFLIDNRFTPWYARKFIKDFPKASALFELREIRTP